MRTIKMINRHIIIGLLCMGYAVVQAQDVDYQHPPINCDVSIFIDYLPAKLMNYHEPEICLYSKPPLCFYLDTMPEHWDNILNGTAVNYCKIKNRTYALAFSRYAADGYLEVNNKVFQYLISNDIDNVPHSFAYYIDGRLIDKHNIKLLLRLRKDRIKSVDVKFDTKTNTIIVEIEKNGISFAHRVFEDYFNSWGRIGIGFICMPEAVARYSSNRDIVALDSVYQSLLAGYLDDTEKYAQSETMRNVIRHIIMNGWMQDDELITFDRFAASNYKSREVGEAMRTMLVTLISF